MRLFFILLAVYYITSYIVVFWMLLDPLEYACKLDGKRPPYARALFSCAIPFVGFFLSLFVLFNTFAGHLIRRYNEDEQK